jgi:hypothetical protein
MKKLIFLMILVFFCSPVHSSEKREKIGEVLGKTIYRDQIKSNRNLYRQLHGLFRIPFERAFVKTHNNELQPQDWEIEYVAAYFKKKHEEKMKDEKENLLIELEIIERKLEENNLPENERKEFDSKKYYILNQLSPPRNYYYKKLLYHWKFHRFLYNKFGGGRVILEQEGLVAFDAMLKWIKFYEGKGDFKIYDSELRKEFYSYWSDMDKNSSFFLNESDLNEFIHPKWEPKRDH